MRDIASPLDGFASPFGPGRRTLTNLLFGTSNATGFTFEPWDMTTLYQDRAGATPVTAVGQSVGYRRDKSGRGNHEVAINDAARGVYGREPKTGTRNRLTYTEQFDNAAWSKAAMSASVGSLTVDATSAQHFVRQTYAVEIGTSYTFHVEAKADTCRRITLRSGSIAPSDAVTFDLITGTVVVGSGVITPMGDGWYQCVQTPSAGVSSTGSRAADIYMNTDAGSGPETWLGDGAKRVFIRKAQLELGASDTAYQSVVSQYDVTEAGVPSCYYVQADGVDDAYVTPTITPGTDKVQVFAGMRKLSDATVGIFAETSPQAYTSNGSFVVGAPDTVATYSFGSTGSLFRLVVSPATFASPTTNVVTGLGDISGDVARLRVNGSQVGQSTADQGTGNYLAYPAYIYGRAGTSFPFNGRDYGHAVRFGPNLDAATIARVEALIARNTPTVTL